MPSGPDQTMCLFVNILDYGLSVFVNIGECMIRCACSTARYDDIVGGGGVVEEGDGGVSGLISSFEMCNIVSQVVVPVSCLLRRRLLIVSHSWKGG